MLVFALTATAGAEPRAMLPLSANTDAKPKAVVHVGPHKTGSTSLQELIYSQVNVLGEDRYRVPLHITKMTYLPKVGVNIAMCYRGSPPELNGAVFNRLLWNSTERAWEQEGDAGDVNSSEAREVRFASNKQKQCTPDIQKAFDGFASKTAAHGDNLMLSSEEFDSAYDTDRLASTLNAFDSTIVVAYRPFFDWIPSLYNQIAKGQGGTRAADLQTLVEVVEEAVANITGFNPWNHYSVAVYDRYKKSFSNVVALDMMGASDMSIPFFCDIANAPHMRAHVRAMKHPHLNTDVNTDHFDVASAAVKKGLVKAHRACLGAVGKMFMQQRPGKLPRKCISKKAQDSLKRLSLDAEKKFFPERDGSELVAQFDDALEKKLCSVDTDSLLAQQRWKSFFAGLSPPICGGTAHWRIRTPLPNKARVDVLNSSRSKSVGPTLITPRPSTHSRSEFMVRTDSMR